jgi:hypothetical protein
MFERKQPGTLVSVVFGGQRISNFTPEAPNVKNESEAGYYTRVISTVAPANSAKRRASAVFSIWWCGTRVW